MPLVDTRADAGQGAAVESQPAGDRALLALFDDLEQQAEGLALTRRDDEVLDRLRDEYAEVDLLSRLHASAGREVVIGVVGGEAVAGSLSRVGSDWCLLENSGWGSAPVETLVHLRLVTSVRGLDPGAQPAAARSVLARLGLTSCLRGLAEAGQTHTVRLVDGTSRVGRVARVGADFVELWLDGTSVVVPLAAMAYVVSGTV
jgi:hypothetical protein